ncbi:MAG: hypothetical protein JST00_10250 [Deltaproteobacteria bacterium]|nr:hypothetical protein [Deltaproteobacteria bacterium]
MIASVVKRLDPNARRFELRLDDGTELEVRIRQNPMQVQPGQRWRVSIRSAGREGVPGGVGATPAAAFAAATLPDVLESSPLTAAMIAAAIEPFGAFSFA